LIVDEISKDAFAVVRAALSGMLALGSGLARNPSQ
jgi:hypothetical protein